MPFGRLPLSNWTLFASTLLEGTPQTLFDAAERKALKIGAAAHASFLDGHNLMDWCEANLNLVNHIDHAKDAISNLKQTATVATYKAAFDSRAAHAGNEGMHLLWWYSGLCMDFLVMGWLLPLS